MKIVKAVGKHSFAQDRTGVDTDVVVLSQSKDIRLALIDEVEGQVYHIPVPCFDGGDCFIRSIGGYSDRSHHAFFFQTHKCVYDVFICEDIDGAVVAQEYVEVVGLEPGKTVLKRLLDMASHVGANGNPAIFAHQFVFAGDDDFLAPPVERFSHNLFTDAVIRGSIIEVDSGIESLVQQIDGLGFGRLFIPVYSVWNADFARAESNF